MIIIYNARVIYRALDTMNSAQYITHVIYDNDYHI